VLLKHRKGTHFLARAVGRILAIAVVGLLLATLSRIDPAAAVSEQAIGAAASRDTSNVAAPDESAEPASPALPQITELTRPPAAIASKPQQPHTTFPYTIRPGDSLGSIASQFGISVAELSRVNHANEETELIVGRLLRIPNPAVVRERELAAQIDQLQRDKQDATDRAMQAETRLTAARTTVQTLTAQCF
jgi:LysM repeat protein